jgi:hypothetical protein
MAHKVCLFLNSISLSTAHRHAFNACMELLQLVGDNTRIPGAGSGHHSVT